MRRFFAYALCAVLISGAAFFGHSRAADAQDLTPAERAALQAEYDQLQKEIAEQQAIIDQTKAKEKSLQGDVTALNAQIAKAEAQIKAKSIAIGNLTTEIRQKSAHIDELSARIARGKESLAAILRQEGQLDDSPAVAVALSAGSVTEFFADLDAFALVKRDLSALFTDIRLAKAETEQEKAALADRQNQEIDARHDVQVKQTEIFENKSEKQQLLAITKNQETEYQKVLAERKARAAAIRSALFPLRDAAAIKFEDALALAKQAEAKTGVRAAFLLAVLTQESNLGANVGQCYLTNDATGAGVGKNTGTVLPNVMKPSRDIPPFLDLGYRLGFDPHHQVVSCPQGGGYGGAMGPAQFIPSTWKVYEARIASATGHSIPNPWDPGDALTAMALYFEDLGASGGSYAAEKTAAAKYYAGSAWATAGQSYARGVMAKADDIQSNVDFLAQN